MKKYYGIYAALLTVAMATFVFGSLAKKANFWMEAAQGNMAEIMHSQLALEKSQNDEVRRYAQMMIDEHTTALNELKQLAASKNVTLPTELTGKHRSAQNKLSGLSATNFDREYMKQMVKDHEATAKLLQNQINKGEDADAKAFAAKMLPAVQAHLEMARNMSNSMKNGGRSGNSNGNSNSGDGMNMNSNSGGNMNSNMNSNSNRNMNSNSNSNSNRSTNSNSNSNRNMNMNSNSNSNSNNF